MYLYHDVFTLTGGRRGTLSLGSILQFVSGTDEEPILGSCIHPNLKFSEVQKS